MLKIHPMYLMIGRLYIYIDDVGTLSGGAITKSGVMLYNVS